MPELPNQIASLFAAGYDEIAIAIVPAADLLSLCVRERRYLGDRLFE
jgi:hypothetical protein